MQLIASPLHVRQYISHSGRPHRNQLSSYDGPDPLNSIVFTLRMYASIVKAIFGVAVSSQKTKLKSFVFLTENLKLTSLQSVVQQWFLVLLAGTTRTAKYQWANITSSVMLCHEFMNGKQPQKWNAFCALMTNKYRTFSIRMPDIFLFVKWARDMGFSGEKADL